MRKYTIASSYRNLTVAFGGSIILLMMLFIGIMVNSIINYLDVWPSDSPLFSSLINPTTTTMLSAALGALLGGTFIGRIINQKAIFYGLLSVLLPNSVKLYFEGDGPDGKGVRYVPCNLILKDIPSPEQVERDAYNTFRQMFGD